MELLYNGVDIAPSVKIDACKYTDCASDRADSVELIFPDADGLWRLWKPVKGDTFEVRSGSITSGKMYVSEIKTPSLNNFVIIGSATPAASLVEASESWENIRLSELTQRLAAEIGMTVDVTGIADLAYARMERDRMTVPGMLEWLAMLESLGMKAYDGRFIFIDEVQLELAEPVLTFGPGAFSSPKFSSSDLGLKHSATVRFVTDDGQTLTGTWTDAAIAGGQIIREIPVSSAGVAERFAKGLLRTFNRSETTGRITVAADQASPLAAGNTIGIASFGCWDGTYYVDRIAHDLLHGDMQLHLRRPIGRDY